MSDSSHASTSSDLHQRRATTQGKLKAVYGAWGLVCGEAGVAQLGGMSNALRRD